MSTWTVSTLLIARRFRWLNEIDPAIAGVITLALAGLFLYYCVYSLQVYLAASADGDDDDDKYGALFYSIGYLFGGLIFGGLSLAFLADAVGNRDSLAYGMLGGSRGQVNRNDDFFNADSMTGNFRSGDGPARDSEPGVRFPEQSSDLERVKSIADAAMERHRERVRDHLDQIEVRRPTPPNPTRSPSNNPQVDREAPAAGPVQTRDPSTTPTTAIESDAVPSTAAVPLPSFQYTLQQAQKSNDAGARGGQEFTAHGPSGSVLVGFKCGLQNDAVCGWQPIYQLEDRYALGEILGALGPQSQLVLARPSYVVGGALVSSDATGMALQLRFVKYDSDSGSLDVFDQYDSPRIGRVSGTRAELDSGSSIVVGLFGHADSQRVHGFGLAVVPPRPGLPVASPDSASNTPSRPARDYRVWYSVDRSFSVEAKLREIKNGKACLEKKDGSIVEVDPARLCPEDNDYLAAQR